MPRLNSNIEKLKKSAHPIAYANTVIEKRSALLDERVVEGYGCIWGSQNGHGEVFVKGCFGKSISEQGPGTNSPYQIKFRDEHGRACSLFAELKEDNVGLYFRTVPLDNVQWANDMLVQLHSGTINNFSIGFRYIWDKVEWDSDKECLMMLEVRLFEISAVAVPSDTATYAVRSIEEPEYLQEDTEEFITSLPKSKQLEARKIITRNISLASQQEPLTADKVKALKKEDKPVKKGIDYNYLLTNLNK